MPAAAPAILSLIDTWIFDLDNTLYAPSTGLFPLIDMRMGAYIQRLLDVDAAEARRVQKAYWASHGTTLNGLMQDHRIDPEDFLTDVHDIVLDALSPDARLAAGLAALPGRRLIFTNADADYAARVLDRLGVADLFAGIHDIRATDYIPKPEPVAYDGLCARFGVDPARAAFVEDMAVNLAPAKALGMTTIWLDNGSESGHRGHDPAFIDFHVHDLADWLDDMTRTKEPCYHVP